MPHSCSPRHHHQMDIVGIKATTAINGLLILQLLSNVVLQKHQCIEVQLQMQRTKLLYNFYQGLILKKDQLKDIVKGIGEAKMMLPFVSGEKVSSTLQPVWKIMTGTGKELIKNCMEEASSKWFSRQLLRLDKNGETYFRDAGKMKGDSNFWFLDGINFLVVKV